MTHKIPVRGVREEDDGAMGTTVAALHIPTLDPSPHRVEDTPSA